MRDLEDYQDQYLNNNPFEPFLVEKRKNLILSIIDKYNPKSILEIGCGDDPLFNYLHDFEKFTVVEPGELFFKYATDFAKKHNHPESISLINTCFEGKTEEVHDYDLIICSALLHELEDQETFMQNLYYLADDSTIVHINMPNVNSFHRLLAKKVGIIKSVHDKSEMQNRLQQNDFFNIAQLKKMCESFGFKIIEEGTLAFKPFTNFQIQQIIDASILDKNIIMALFDMEEYCPGLGAEMFVNLKK